MFVTPFDREDIPRLASAVGAFFLSSFHSRMSTKVKRLGEVTEPLSSCIHSLAT
jgi:hypothetical protein